MDDCSNGFLFIGNRLALDFVNTLPVIGGASVELLADVDALTRWARAAGFVPSRWDTSPLRELQAFRERLRESLIRYEQARPPSRKFLDELNRRLKTHPLPVQVALAGGTLTATTDPHLRKAEDLWPPLLDDVAKIFTQLDRSRIRKCDGCVLHFYDISKKGTRRWCSMRMCGNRAKVSAYAERNRAQDQ